MTIPTDDGLYPGLSREIYDAIERENISKLANLKRSPLHLRAAELQEKEPTDDMRVGSAAHVATLEPERFASAYAIWQGARRAGKEWEKFKTDNAGIEILTVAQRDRVLAIRDAAMGHKRASQHLSGGQAELTILWTHVEPAIGNWPGFSIKCKGRIDFANGGITDLKTTRDASKEAFERQCHALDYHVRAAFYVDGYRAVTGKLLTYRIVAVENTYPHAVNVRVVEQNLLDVGRATYRGWLAMLHQCRTSGVYNGYSDGEETPLELPSYARPDEDETNEVEFDHEENAHAAGL